MWGGENAIKKKLSWQRENKKIKLSLAMLNVINQQPGKTGAD